MFKFLVLPVSSGEPECRFFSSNVLLSRINAGGELCATTTRPAFTYHWLCLPQGFERPCGLDAQNLRFDRKIVLARTASAYPSFRSARLLPAVGTDSSGCSHSCIYSFPCARSKRRRAGQGSLPHFQQPTLFLWSLNRIVKSQPFLLSQIK